MVFTSTTNEVHPLQIFFKLHVILFPHTLFNPSKHLAPAPPPLSRAKNVSIEPTCKFLDVCALFVWFISNFFSQFWHYPTRCLSLAELYHTQVYKDYLQMKTTWKNKDNLKNKDFLKNENNMKNKDDLHINRMYLVLDIFCISIFLQEN